MMSRSSARRADLAQPRHDWTLEEGEALFELPVTELVFRAAEVHRRAVQCVDVKRGADGEDE